MWVRCGDHKSLTLRNILALSYFEIWNSLWSTIIEQILCLFLQIQGKVSFHPTHYLFSPRSINLLVATKTLNLRWSRLAGLGLHSVLGNIFIEQTKDGFGLLIEGTIINKKASMFEQSHTQDFLLDFKHVSGILGLCSYRNWCSLCIAIKKVFSNLYLFFFIYLP